MSSPKAVIRSPPVVAVEPLTWESVLAALEHDVTEISEEECALNLRQPEFVYGRMSKLERAWEAHSQGLPVADWCVRERDATRLRLRLELESKFFVAIAAQKKQSIEFALSEVGNAVHR